MAAVSQGILAPGLFRLKRLGYGQIKGINTLLIAASSLDNIISIVAFRISVGILFSKGKYSHFYRLLVYLNPLLYNII